MLAHRRRSTPTAFPGSLWLAGALGVWAVVELALAARAGGLARVRSGVRQAAPATLVAIAVLAVVAAPELGRMVDFASFETFDPAGSGLGNLFNRLSPLEALGIWPSGDFRVEPGDGAVPAVVFYLGAALAAGRSGLRAAVVVARARARRPGGARRRGRCSGSTRWSPARPTRRRRRWC